MPERIRVFVDFWNLQLAWNDRAPQIAKLDWPQLPQVLVQKAMQLAGIDDYQYDGTTVYASVDVTTPDGGRHRNWLNSFLARQAGINVHISERRPRPRSIHCRICNSEITHCPKCNQQFLKAGEKGVDAAIVTELLSLAWADAYEVAILVSSDADYVPAVENLQAKGFKIVNATWRNQGHHLAQKSWLSIEIDNYFAELTRT